MEYTVQQLVEDVKGLAIARLSDPYYRKHLSAIPVVLAWQFTSPEDILTFALGDGATFGETIGKWNTRAHCLHNGRINIYLPSILLARWGKQMIARDVVHEMGHALVLVMAQKVGENPSPSHDKKWVDACYMLGLHTNPYTGGDAPRREQEEDALKWEPDMQAAIAALPEVTDLAALRASPQNTAKFGMIWR